jgi:hypothetical protein
LRPTPNRKEEQQQNHKTSITFHCLIFLAKITALPLLLQQRHRNKVATRFSGPATNRKQIEKKNCNKLKNNGLKNRKTALSFD